MSDAAVLDPKTAFDAFRTGLGELGKEPNDGQTINERPASGDAGVDRAGAASALASAPATTTPLTVQPGQQAAGQATGLGEIPEDKWPRTAKDWDSFKKARKEKETALSTELTQTKAKIKEYEERLAKAPTATVDPAELDTLKKERDQLSEHLRVVAVENHPKFKTYFEGKTNSQIDLAKRIVGQENGDAVAKLLQLPDSEWKDAQIEALMAELPPVKQAQIGGVLNALASIQQERTMEISRAKENYDKIVGGEKAKADAARQSAEKMFSDALAQAQDPEKGVAAYQKRDNDSTWNTGVDERAALAKAFLMGTAKPESIVQAALNAAMVPAVLEHAKSLHDENTKLKAQVAELTKAGPGLGGGKGAEGEAIAVKIAPGANPQEAVSAFVKSLHADWKT